MKTRYKVGDIMIAVSRFQLEDIRSRNFYYSVGDEFIIMNIMNIKDNKFCSDIIFQLHTKDSVFKWQFRSNELYELKRYIVHKEDFIRAIRKQKLEKLEKL